MRDRHLTDKPISCEHCGTLPNEFVEYDESGVTYCSLCANANGCITVEQMYEDQADSLEQSIIYYTNLVNSAKNKLYNLRPTKRPNVFEEWG